jgi:ATP-dependent RNA helicase RhlE
MSETITQPGFAPLGLPSSQLETLNRLGFTVPTPIQENAIPVALTGRDVIGIAQTGTGKTLAFGLPMMARLKAGQMGLVIAPTRELAQQIEDTYRALGTRTALLIGGASMNRQIDQIRAKPSVIVATPGRLIDHLQQRTVKLDRVAIAVLDEADRMLDMGFAPAIRRILDMTPPERQTMLFSATMPPEIADLAQRYQRDPIRVEIARAGTAAETVEQELLVVAKEEKHDVLGELLRDNPGTVLVFARTRHGARKLAKSVRLLGHSAAELHSDRTLAQRKAALDGFKKGAYRVLVATDIAARGIDVKEIALVVNYDLPDNPEDYVHRIGRTGRAGASGRAVTLATPEQGSDVRDIERLLKTELPLSDRSRAVIQRPQGALRPVSGARRGGNGQGGGTPRAAFRPRGR